MTEAIPLHVDVDLTAIMRRENIATIKAWPAGYFSVELSDGSFATAKSVGQALVKAQRPGAENIRKMSA